MRLLTFLFKHPCKFYHHQSDLRAAAFMRSTIWASTNCMPSYRNSVNKRVNTRYMWAKQFLQVGGRVELVYQGPQICPIGSENIAEVYNKSKICRVPNFGVVL